MKSALHKRWWFIVGCALVAIIGFRHVWMWLPEHRYASMLQHLDLIAALQNDNPSLFKNLSHRYGYDYQVFTNGHLLEGSRPDLPYLRLVSQPPATPGVLAVKLEEQLAGSNPYQYSHGFHRYIFFSTTAGQYTYVLYGKVL